MKKLSANVYNRLVLQAQEAKNQNLDKLSNGILQCVGPFPEENNEEFSQDQLKEAIYNSLWKIATDVINYYDLQTPDALKIDRTLETLSDKVLDEIKKTLEVKKAFGPKEPKVLGEK